MVNRLLLAALLLTCVASTGCATVGGEDVASGEDALNVERTVLPTSLTTLLAGDPYTPVLDERPLALGGRTSCLEGPVVAVTPGSTSVEAAVITSQKELNDKLDISISGLPFSLGRLGGAATGSARLARETKLNANSVTLMFQARGTFESELRGLGALPTAISAVDVPRCGWGYVTKAYHKLSAVVMVTIEAVGSSSTLQIGCGPDDQDCTATGVTVGPTQIRFGLEKMLRRGSFNISVQTATDRIPELQPTPLGSMAALTSTPETADQVIDKLGAALDWLGTAQNAISERIGQLQGEVGAGAAGAATSPSAPTTKVEFAYYPGLVRPQKESLTATFDNVVKLRNQYTIVLDRIAAWTAFEDARANDQGHFFNVPNSPVRTVERLVERSTEVLKEDGILQTRRNELERDMEICADTVGNRDEPVADVGSLVVRVAERCKAPQLPAWEPEYDKLFGIKRLAPLSVKPGRFDACPAGQRYATRAESVFLGPWSHVTQRDNQTGIWVQKDALQYVWIRQGNVEGIGLLNSTPGLNACFSESGLFAR